MSRDSGRDVPDLEKIYARKSMPNMTGRPGHRTMEMNGGSSAPYLARTPCVPLVSSSFNRVGDKERFRLPGAGGGSFQLYGGTFVRSYSVSRKPWVAFFNTCLCADLWIARIARIAKLTLKVNYCKNWVSKVNFCNPSSPSNPSRPQIPASNAIFRSLTL